MSITTNLSNPQPALSPAQVLEYLLVVEQSNRPRTVTTTRTTINLLAFGVGLLLPLAFVFYGGGFHTVPHKAHVSHVRAAAVVPSQRVESSELSEQPEPVELESN